MILSIKCYTSNRFYLIFFIGVEIAAFATTKTGISYCFKSFPQIGNFFAHMNTDPLAVKGLNPVLLTFKICMVSHAFSHMTSLSVANAYICSCLYYCNCLSHSLSSKNNTRLYIIQYCLARFVSGASRFSCHSNLKISPLASYIAFFNKRWDVRSQLWSSVVLCSLR